MREPTLTTRLIRGILILSVTLTAWTAGHALAADLVVFGDSLSDPGNFFIETGQSVSAPYQPAPAAPYAIGGHHFTNGRTWIEQLAGRLRAPLAGRPALRSPGLFTNYAFGRSRARANAAGFPQFDLGAQVILFLTDFGVSAVLVRCENLRGRPAAADRLAPLALGVKLTSKIIATLAGGWQN